MLRSLVGSEMCIRDRSDNRLKTTAGFYKRKRINGIVDSEIILSKPILSKLSTREINSTLCHEMIHAWVDRILKKHEIHGPNFLAKMNEINEREKNFQISVRHSFPIVRRELKYIGTCQNCGEKFFYRKRTVSYTHLTLPTICSV